jgi:O-antigen/teichoic acid export membrane protein
VALSAVTATADPGGVAVLEPPLAAPAAGLAGNGSGNSSGSGSGNLEAVARGGALSMVGALVSAVANLALTVVITHGVGRSTAGEFFALTSVFLLAEVLCRLGADVGLIYFLARWRVQGRFEAMRVGLRVGMQPPLIFAVVVGATMFAAAEPLSRWVGAGTHGIGLLRLLAVALPIVVVYDLSLAATRGWARMRPTVLIDKIARPVGQLALVAAVLFLGWKSMIGVGWALPYFAAAVASIAALRALPWRKAGRYEGSTRTPAATAHDTMTEDARQWAAADARPAVAREFWRFTAPRAVAAVAQLLLQRLDIVLVAALRGPVDAAVYTAATRFLVVGQFVNMALVAPAQPRLSALLAARDIEGTRELFQTTTSWLVVFVWPMYLAIAVLAPSYLHVFGSGYSSGLWVVILLCLAMMVASAVGFVDVILLMVGKSGWNMGTTVAALAVDAGLDVVLIPHIGIVGAAIGWCGAILAANLVPGLLVMRLVGIHPFSRATITAIAITTACFAVIPLAVGLPLGGGQAALLGGVALGTLVYAAALWRLRHTLMLNLAATAIMRRKR